MLVEQFRSILEFGSFYGSEVSVTFDDFKKESVIMNTIALTADEMSIDKDTVYKILRKYGYRCPYSSDIGSFNRLLRELMIMIGFNDKVKRQAKVLGKIIDKSDYKYNLISSHTARRTFVNINIKRRKTSIEIHRATGHRTYFGYSKYLCYDAH